MGVRLLLDTHTAAWWWFEDSKLVETARRAIGDKSNQVFVSAVTAWEMANKNRLGKWAEAGVIVDGFERLLAEAGFRPLPITTEHARLAGRLNGDPRDPFDRMLAAQGLFESLVIVSVDRAFRNLGVPVLWSELLH